jgi:heme exporter protein A
VSAAQLQARALGCTMGHRRLFERLDFSLAAGQWLMLAGPNGSGKSTLLRILAGLSSPDSGDVLWQDQPRRRGDPLWHATLLYQGHANGWKEQLGTRENLAMQAALDFGPGGLGSTGREIDSALARVGLARQHRLPFARLSAGQRRRLGLARLALVRRPLWLLDEPTTALDSDGQQLFGELLDAHLDTGGCAVIATHLPFPAAREPQALRLGERA